MRKVVLGRVTKALTPEFGFDAVDGKQYCRLWSRRGPCWNTVNWNDYFDIGV